MTAPVQLALLIVGLWLLIAAAVLAVLVALGLAGERVGLAVRRAYYRRTPLGYPPDGGPPRYVLTRDGWPLAEDVRNPPMPARAMRAAAAAAAIAIAGSALVACDDPHKGEHCVRERTTVTTHKVGKVKQQRTSTRCVEWAPDATQAPR